ncbi:4Fe-4S dicluster domain-containing protein [bacterium]|nr:4Fe-4S dicluster domain-containing protein [bacterium]
MKRRSALKLLGTTLFTINASTARAEVQNEPNGGGFGCLVDTTLCIGCRECEKACNRANNLAPLPTEFNERGVFEDSRRPDPNHFTVVNRFPGAPSRERDHQENTYTKMQCMHCNDPACVSACIVGALQKTDRGAVTYDEDRCIGCRYCLVACPFQIPSYEYNNALAPRVRKCEFCVERQEEGQIPACAAACPREAIVFGPRNKLLPLAQKRIQAHPGRYIDRIYGQKEAGGTAWLYLAGRPFEEIGFPAVGEDAPPRLTETIQHGVFKYGLPPLLLYGALAGLMKITQKSQNDKK